MPKRPSLFIDLIRFNGICKEYAEKFALYSDNAKQVSGNPFQTMKEHEEIFYNSTKAIREKAIFFLIEIERQHEKIGVRKPMPKNKMLKSFAELKSDLFETQKKAQAFQHIREDCQSRNDCQLPPKDCRISKIEQEAE